MADHRNETVAEDTLHAQGQLYEVINLLTRFFFPPQPPAQ